MFITRNIVIQDGLKISYRVYGTGEKHDTRPLICLAGLTRNSRDFHPFCEALQGHSARSRLIITIDSRGRGQSDRDPDATRYTLPVEAGDVLDVMTAEGIAQADFIGTSRGGLILHLLASIAPERLGSMVFNDVGPEIGLEGMRQIQSYLDPNPEPRSRRMVLTALKLVHGDAFPALDAADWEEMVDALHVPISAIGDYAAAKMDADVLMLPDFDPAIAAMVKSMDLSAPLPDLWPLFDLLRDKRLLVVRGENSKLLTEDTLFAMKQRHPGMAVMNAPGQGHAPLLHLGELPQAISTFLDAG